MTKEMLLMLVVAVVVAATAAALKGAGRRKASGDIRAKKLLTGREQSMFHRLQQAFPNDIVLIQVAFSALITAKDLPTRETFNRKVADFVVTTMNRPGNRGGSNSREWSHEEVPEVFA